MIVFLHDFYLLLLLLAAGGGYWLARERIRRYEASQVASPIDYSDPYLIAALRGGPRAAVELAVVGLVDRGLIKSAGGTFDKDAVITTTRPDAVDFGANALERAILDAARQSVAANEVGKAEAVAAAAEGYQHRLADARLIVDGAYRSELFSIALVCALPALAIIALRGLTVVSGDKYRLLALIAGAIVMAAYFITLLSRTGKRTQGGHKMLEDLGDLFSGLLDRRRDLTSARMSNDAIFCGAVFGLLYLPAEAFPAAAFYVAEEERRRDKGTDTGGGCGSSCGSGCGSDGGGGGDGGGGCGGGCS